ncbi:MAG: DUF21 domain-containing protein [Desulfobacterales bacterium]
MDLNLWVNISIWIGIGLCLSQSAVFSGMNLAVFSISRMRLEVEVRSGNQHAEKVLALRQNTNLLLTTILWGNVGVNVLLALLSNSVMTGMAAFLFSTVVITFIGEILPQAYFSRHALQMAARLSGLLRFYRTLLYPVARPSAAILDLWLGQEGIHYMREQDLRHVIHMHMEAEETDVEIVEGIGALNFLKVDDLIVTQEGEPVDPLSIVAMPTDADGLVRFPAIEASAHDPFLQRIERSGHKWVILTDDRQTPQLVMDADGFLRAALFGHPAFNPYDFCHRPVIVADPETRLGDAIQRLKASPHKPDDHIIDRDVILIWTDQVKRVITGADLLGRLLIGIAPKAVG